MGGALKKHKGRRTAPDAGAEEKGLPSQVDGDMSMAHEFDSGITSNSRSSVRSLSLLGLVSRFLLSISVYLCVWVCVWQQEQQITPRVSWSYMHRASVRVCVCVCVYVWKGCVCVYEHAPPWVAGQKEGGGDRVVDGVSRGTQRKSDLQWTVLGLLRFFSVSPTTPFPLRLCLNSLCTPPHLARFSD